MIVDELRASFDSAVAELTATGEISVDGKLHSVPQAPQKPRPQTQTPTSKPTSEPSFSSSPLDEPVQFDPALHASWEGLTPAQNLAMTALLGGDTVSRASRYVGVHRNTVSRWKNQHPRFREVYDQMRQEMHEATIQQLHGVSLNAAACVADNILAGDPKASFQLLRGLGYLSTNARAPRSSADVSPIHPESPPQENQPPVSRDAIGVCLAWRMKRLWSLLLSLLVWLVMSVKRATNIVKRRVNLQAGLNSRQYKWLAILHHSAPSCTAPWQRVASTARNLFLAPQRSKRWRVEGGGNALARTTHHSPLTKNFQSRQIRNPKPEGLAWP